MADNFKYESLKSSPPLVPESDFTYRRFSLKEVIPPEGGWFDTPWFDDWFGPDENFKYQKVK